MKTLEHRSRISESIRKCHEDRRRVQHQMRSSAIQGLVGEFMASRITILELVDKILDLTSAKYSGYHKTKGELK